MSQEPRQAEMADPSKRHHQPWGLVHGGLYTTVIESFATTGAYDAVKDQGQHAVGVTNVTDFLRPHQSGRLSVPATAIRQGRTTRPEDGKPIARGRMRLHNVDAVERS